ncbi:MAG: RHS repeat-associated core domain-containing protein, partial [Candidatus Brocadiia bacterium]
LDNESGQYYYRTRMYNTSTGRFSGRDSVEYEGGVNLYSYVGSNPANNIDPFGELWLTAPTASTGTVFQAANGPTVASSDSTQSSSTTSTASDDIHIPLPGDPRDITNAGQNQMAQTPVKPVLRKSEDAPKRCKYLSTEKYFTGSIYYSTCKCPKYMDIIYAGVKRGECPLKEINFHGFWVHPSSCSCYYKCEWKAPGATIPFYLEETLKSSNKESGVEFYTEQKK